MNYSFRRSLTALSRYILVFVIISCLITYSSLLNAQNSISGTTWHDQNGDGIKDSGEPFINGVTVTLNGTADSGAPVNMSQFTTVNGSYQFTNVPQGNGYFLNFSMASTYDSFTSSGGDSSPDPATGNTTTFDVQINSIINNIDAGYWRYVTIGDWVWEDINGNGIQDDGATGVQGVKVQLGDENGVLIAEVFTDADGNYIFDDVGPGLFKVAFLPDPPYFLTDQNQGGAATDSDPDPDTGWTDVFELNSGETDNTKDAGVWRSVQIGDYCWRDQNQNGIQDAGEFAMSDIEVMLFRASDGVDIATVVTDAAGLYQFGPNPPIKPGQYYLRFGIPATFNLTIQNAGGNPALDSDPNPATGMTNTLLFLSGVTNITIDAGYYVIPPIDCEPPPAYYCVEAEVLCALSDLNEFCASMVEQFTSIPIPGCGPGYAWHNPSWYAFVAGAQDVELIIHTFNCVAGTGNIGIQYGFYENCSYANPPLLQCSCVDAPGDYYVELTGLTVGNTYYFFIDGCNGTQCTYWIEIVEGGGVPEVLGPYGIECDADFPDCEDICVGAQVTFTMDEVYNSGNYEWTISGGAVIETSDPELTYQFTSPGTYIVCGRGINDCDEGDWFCFDVIVTQLPPEDLGTLDVCVNDIPDGVFPEGWEGPPITTAGSNVFSTINEQGCYYEQHVFINATNIRKIVIDTIGCSNEEMWIAGVQFVSDVSNISIIVENPDSNACDEQYIITITFVEIDGYIDAECSGIKDLPVRLFFVPTENKGNTDISYQWQLNAVSIENDDPATPNEINVNQNGDYSVIISLISDKGMCTYDHFAKINIDLDHFTIDTTVSKSGNTLTATETDAKYQWLNCYAGMSHIYGETKQSFTPVINGSYAVKITKNGCVDTSLCHVVILTSILENTFGEMFSVYPNPTKGKINVDLPEEYQEIEVVVTDNNGKTISRKQYKKSSLLELEIDGPSGIYYLNVTVPGKRAVVKVVKQ